MQFYISYALLVFKFYCKRLIGLGATYVDEILNVDTPAQCPILELTEQKFKCEPGEWTKEQFAEF